MVGPSILGEKNDFFSNMLSLRIIHQDDCWIWGGLQPNKTPGGENRRSLDA